LETPFQRKDVAKVSSTKQPPHGFVSKLLKIRRSRKADEIENQSLQACTNQELENVAKSHAQYRSTRLVIRTFPFSGSVNLLHRIKANPELQGSGTMPFKMQATITL